MLHAMGEEEVTIRIAGSSPHTRWYWTVRVYAQIPTFTWRRGPWRGYP